MASERQGLLVFANAAVLDSVRDPEIFKLLDVAKKIFNNHLIDVKDLLSQLAVPSAGRG